MAESTVKSLSEALVDLTKEAPIRILHVDDEAGFLKSARQCLEMQGAFMVETAVSVEEALEKMKEKTYDAIVADYVMPAKDGLEFLKELREEGNNIPFIMFTGKGREEVAVKALNLGADRYFNKIGQPQAVYGELAHGIREAVKAQQAEQALHESEERLRSLVESTEDIIIVQDVDGKYLYYNAAPKYGLKTEDVLGKTPSDFFDPPTATKMMERVKQVASSGQSVTVETRLVWKGEKLWFIDSIYPIEDENGHVTAVGTISRNITERKKAEEALRASEEKLRNIFQSANDCIFYLDKSGRIVDVNRKAVELFGRSRKELFGRHFAKVGGIPLKNLPTVMKAFAQSLAGKQHTLSVCIKDKSGQGIPLECSSSLVKADGKITGVLVIARDVTERKRAEEQLRDSEKRYRTLFETIKDGIAASDMDGHVVECNQAYADMLGYSKDELKRMTLQQVTPKKWHRISTEKIEQLWEGGYSDEYEKEYIRKDGTVFPVSIRGWLIRDEDGKPNAIWGIIRDITKRKRMEEMLQRTSERHRLLLENVPSYIMTLDKNGIIRYVNHTQYTKKKDVIGKRAIDFLKPEYRRQHTEDIRQAFETGKISKTEVATIFGQTAHQTLMPLKHEEEVIEVMAVVRDITERKKTEEALSKSEEKWRSLLENAPDFITIVDRDATIQYINRTVPDLTKEDVVGKSLYDFTQPEYHGKYGKIVPRVFETGQVITLVTRGIGPKGIDTWFENRVAPIKHGGQVIAAEIISTDVTERKKAEEELRKSEAKYRSLVDNAASGIITVDNRGKFTFVNEAICEMIGYSERELIDKPFADFIHPSDRKRILQIFGNFMRNPELKPNFEFRVVHKKGHTLHLHSAPTLIKHENEIVGSHAIITDITKRKRIEETIRESEEKFRDIFENASDAMIYMDKSGRILDVNKKAVKVFGGSKKEVVGKHFTKVGVVSARDIPRLISAFAKGIAGKRPTLDISIKNKKGLQIHLECLGSAIEADGKTTGNMVIARDVSERKQAEEELKKTLGKVHILNEKLSVVGGLTRHDVRSKLSAVINNVYLAKQKLTDNPEALEHLSDIESACDQMVRIFDFARVYEMLGVEELTNIDVNKSFEEAVSLFSDLHGVKVINNCHGLTILADSLLRQLFYNLIDNSLKYGEKVSQIRAHYERGKGKIKLVYEDDGVGVPKAEKEKIFKEGYGKGTGYGLYLVRKICEVYGWTIRETGKHGKGAQFTITIPTAAPK